MIKVKKKLQLTYENGNGKWNSNKNNFEIKVIMYDNMILLLITSLMVEETLEDLVLYSLWFILI